MNPDSQRPQPETSSNWAYTSGNLVEDGVQAQPMVTDSIASNEELVSWSASEFVEHEKSKRWYVNLIIVATVLAGLIFLITRQILSVVMIVVMALLFGVYGAAKPKVLDYVITAKGLQVGNRFFSFNSIKSFSVITEEGMPYIQLLMQKRLSVPITVYAAPDQIELVASTLGQFIPYDQKRRDIADKISSRIRF